MIPDGFVLAEEIRGGGPQRPIEVHVARHDYMHEGYLVRTVARVHEDGVGRTWEIWVGGERSTTLRCCSHKRSYVPEAPKQLWEPRSGRKLRRATGRIRSVS